MAAGSGDRRGLLALLVVPLLLLGPIVLGARVFLPQVPAALEPWRSEDPARAERAREGMHYLASDRLLPVLTDQLAIRAALLQGEAPLWEPALGLGAPLFAESIAGAAYPPNALAVLLPPEHAAGPLAGLGLLLAGLGLFLFLRRRGLPLGAALVGALGYQLGGWGIANLFYAMKVDAALWLPWALWAVEGIARGRRWSGLALTVAVAASLVAGMVPIGFFVTVTTALYAALRLTPIARRIGLEAEEPESPQPAPSPDVRWPRLASATLFVVLGGLAAAVLLLPVLEARRNSDRRPVGVPGISAMALPVGTLGGAVVSDLVGAPTDPTPAGCLPVAWWLTPAEDFVRAETANALEWNTYAGAVVVLLALVGVIAAPRRALVPLVLLLLTLGLAQSWPGVRWLYHLPGFDVAAPGRALGLAWVLWPWLAALGAQAWMERRLRAERALLFLAFAAAATAFLLWSRFDPEVWALGVEQDLIERYAATHAPTLETIRERLPLEGTVAAGERLARSLGILFGATLGLLGAAATGLLLDRPRAAFGSRLLALRLGLASLGVLLLALLPAAGRALASGSGLAPGLAALIGAALLGGLLARRGGGWTEALPRALPLLLLVLAEGLLAAHGHVSGRRLEEGLFPPSPGLDAIVEAAGDGRLVRYDPSPTGIEHVVDLARPNLLQPSGVGDLAPWIVFPPRTFNELFAAIDPASRRAQGVSRISDPELVSHPALDLLRVSAVLARDPLEHPRLEPVLERPGLHVYRRSGALPAARLVPVALAATGDEAALSALASGLVDPGRQTLLAPEHADAAAAGPQDEDLDPGELALLERPERGRIRAEVRGSQGGWLVLHEQHYPGWEARLDGERVELLRADHAYQAVALPAGDHVVEFRYAPASARLGSWITILALLAALIASRRLGL